MVELFLETPGIDVNADDGSRFALKSAASNGHDTVLKTLLAFSKTNINKRDNNGWPAFFDAAVMDRPSTLNIFLEHPDTALDMTSNAGQTILVLVLGSHLAGGAFEQQDYDLQPIASMLLDHPTIQQLAGTPDHDGWTPLILASKFGYSAIVKRLISLPGVEVNARNEEGRNALELAMEGGHEDVVKMLRDAGTL